MTSAGKRMSICIDKNAFEQFLKEKASGMKQSAVADKIGVEKTGFSHAKRHGYFSLENLSRMSKFFGVNMWNLPFVNDEAYTISFKLTTDLDLHLRAKMIDQIRGLLADGIPQAKVRDVVLSDILAGKYTRSTQSDSESKAIPMEVPKATLTHSEVSEAFDEVANSEKETLGNYISEHADKLVMHTDPTDMHDSPFAKVVDETEAYHTSVRDAEKRLRLRELLLNSDPQIKNQFIMNVGRISNMEKYLRDHERTTAQALAQEIVKYLVSCSESRPRRIEYFDCMDNIINLHGKWSAMHESCNHLHIYVKKRPLLDTVYFFIVNGDFLTGFDAKYVDDIKLRLYEEVEFIGRYPIKTNTDDVKACEKEEE